MIYSRHWPENNDFYIYAKEKGHGELIEKLGYNGRGGLIVMDCVEDNPQQIAVAWSTLIRSHYTYKQHFINSAFPFSDPQLPSSHTRDVQPSDDND